MEFPVFLAGKVRIDEQLSLSYVGNLRIRRLSCLALRRPGNETGYPELGGLQTIGSHYSIDIAGSTCMGYASQSAQHQNISR